LQGTAPKEIHTILTETLASLLPGRAKDLSALLYCAIFHSAYGFEWVNMLSDTEAAYVNNALALCLKSKSITTGPNNCTQTATHT